MLDMISIVLDKAMMKQRESMMVMEPSIDEEEAIKIPTMIIEEKSLKNVQWIEK